MTHSGAELPDSSMYELVGRYVRGELTAAEERDARRTAHALLSRPDGLELLRDVMVEEGMLRMLLERVRVEHGHGSAPMRAVAGASDRSPTVLHWQRRNATPLWRRSVARAAAVLLVLGGFAAGYANSTALPWLRRSAPAQWQTVTAWPGQRVTVDLPDGSRAILAPNTRLQYAMRADNGPRELQLDGEAYFDVQHDDKRPFRVRTHRAVVEDLGTEFVVREYSADRAVRVAVRSGAVTLRAHTTRESSALHLTQGDAVDLDSTGIAVRLHGDSASYWAWTAGRLVFDRAPLPAVLAQLNRWYNVDFELSDTSLVGEYFTGAFETESLPQILDILSPLVHARFEQRGRTYVVTERPAVR